MREGQLACAAVLIEGGARISERALRAVKLEPAMAPATGKRCENNAWTDLVPFGVDICAGRFCVSILFVFFAF